MVMGAWTWGGSGHKKPPQGFLAAVERLEIGLVVDEQPAPRGPHEASIAQDSQVLGDGPLRDAELDRQGPNTEGSLRHQLEQAQAHLDGEGFQKAGYVGNVCHGLDYFSDR
jgi:hypothetical protein